MTIGIAEQADENDLCNVGWGWGGCLVGEEAEKGLTGFGEEGKALDNRIPEEFNRRSVVWGLAEVICTEKVVGAVLAERKGNTKQNASEFPALRMFFLVKKFLT
jgi:hypothetical protein